MYDVSLFPVSYKITFEIATQMTQLYGLTISSFLITLLHLPLDIFDVVKHFTVFWKYLNSCRLKRLVGFSIWFTKMITRKIKSNKRSNFLRNMILTHFYFRVLRTWFLHVVYGRHVIIWCNMKTMRHETYVLFTSICIFLFFARSIICLKYFLQIVAKTKCANIHYLCGRNF